MDNIKVYHDLISTKDGGQTNYQKETQPKWLWNWDKEIKGLLQDPNACWQQILKIIKPACDYLAKFQT